jgi:uncharacterized membrane protein
MTPEELEEIKYILKKGNLTLIIMLLIFAILIIVGMILKI